jgi:hypothetical protein
MAWVVALSMAERMSPSAGGRLADYLEVMSTELLEAWSPVRGS